ncbi:synaptotagmin-7-like [Clavelina lepadiformis]|uniref:synaptotagmin-7-like n=1 Tax=Clavelina lepadiformis TaxID=159417 RepID=UPI0040419663
MGSGASKQVQPSSKQLYSKSKSEEYVDEDEKALEDHKMYLENMYMLKRMFKQLDPAVMKTTSDVQGEVKVSVKHVSDKSLLLVKVIAAQDLLAKDVRGHTSDPYVKVELLLNHQTAPTSSEEYSNVRSTAVVKNNLNPVFNEIFTFSLTTEQINIAQLRCSVWCYDALGRDDFMGERIISVSDLDCHDNVQTAWYELLPEIDLSIGGYVSIKLTYKLPQTLNVMIQGANNINAAVGNVEPYVRVYIPGVPYVYKTKPCKNEDSLVWNEDFDFPLPKEELTSRYIVLVLADGNSTESYFGECHIDLDNFQFEHGFEGSFALSDMRGNVTVRSRWTRNAITQEFKEALEAHAMYRKPEFMFSRVRGTNNAGVTVRVPKAGAQSRLRVVNGILVH